MKNLYPLLLGLLLSIPAFSQISYSGTEATVFLEREVEKFGYIYVRNFSGVPIEYEWEFLSNSFNENWAIQFCECTSCYTNEFGNFVTAADSGQYCGNLADQGEIEWKIGIHPNGEPISVEEFSVVVHDITNGTSDTLSWVTDISLNVELTEKNAVSYSVYPNPASDRLTVSIANQNLRNGRVTLRNVLGELVYSNSFSNGNTHQLSLDNLNKGVYFVEVFDEKQSLFVERLVISQ